MPWNSGQGKFIRSNPDFTGETVWQQDQQATIKIIAARHDSHDQDLADGISACLNLDGINSMRDNLNVNNNKIVNLAAGTAPTDAVNFQQLETQNTDLTDYIDAGDQGSKDYADTVAAAEAADVNITSVGWAGNVITLNKGDGSNVNQTIDTFTGTLNVAALTATGKITAPTVEATELRGVTIKSNGPIRHKSEAFTSGGVVTLQALDSSRWTLANNGATTLNFEAPSGSDAYLGEDYEVEGSVLISNGATPGVLTLQINGSGVPADRILGANSTVSNANYLLSYVIHRSVGNSYNFLFIWSAVTS